jgi:hypothetical protein
MITNLQLGMTLFLKPSGHCRAQMHSISSQAFKTWCLVTARRIGSPRRPMPTLGSPRRPRPSLLLGSLRQVTLQALMLESPRRQWLRLRPLWSLLLVPQLDILPTYMVIHNSTTIIKRNMLLFYRNCWVISNNFPVSPGIQIEGHCWYSSQFCATAAQWGYWQ